MGLKNIFFFQIFKELIFIQIYLSICSNKNILIFNSSHYISGHAAFTSNGDMIIDYSYENKRLFYGLKKNGKNYFDENEGSNSTKMITVGEIDDECYQARNIFISLNNSDGNKQYLFSISSKSNTIELFDLERNEYHIKKSSNLLGYNLNCNSFSLISLHNTKQYLIGYLTGSSSFIKIISFSDFQLNNNIVNSIQQTMITTDSKAINCFLMNDKIILFYLFQPNYQIDIYNLDLTTVAVKIDISVMSYTNSKILFFKGLHLTNDILAFIYFTSILSTSLTLNIGYVENIAFKTKLTYYFNQFEFESDSQLNDFIKINENRLAYIGKYDYSTFGIILIDIYNDIKNMKIRIFYFDLNDHDISTGFEALIYNNYLAISSTVVKKDANINNDMNKYSIFLIFGYMNGTDITMDINKYINNNNNLVLDLTENIDIDNNIFGYELITDQIKLVYIPEPLLFYNNNSNKLLENNNILEKNYTLIQNGNFTSNNNYLEYQIILIEAEYDSFNNISSEIINSSASGMQFIDERQYYNRSMFFGRTNTINFVSQKCHEFCLTCSELGISDNDQKCITCKEEYSYGFPGDITANCVPENKFYDNDKQQLIECNKSNSFFFIDQNNKKICFKKNKNCPNEYPILNLESGECSKNQSIIYSEMILSGSSIITQTLSNCSHDNYINGNCTIIFNDNKEAYNYMLQILSKYEPEEEKSIYFKTESNMTFEITTTAKEKNELNGNSIKDNLTIIDIDECENILRDFYDINENISLIFLKSENLNSIPSEKNVQYEIYEALNKTKLNLSLCEGTNINLYFPIELNSQTQKLYDDLNKQGYDIFNMQDKFYQDICTPYKSENGTDILLSDRINDIFYKNNNLTSCQENCDYSGYSSETKLLKCECNVNTEPIDYKNQKKFTPNKIYESFYDVLKYSNYKIIKCYKLIFYRNPISKNLGSILVLIDFGIYLLFLIIFIFKGTNPLKIDILKSVSANKKKNEQSDNKLKNNNINNNMVTIHTKKSKKSKFLFPPKRKLIDNNRKAKKKKIINKSKKPYQIKNVSFIDNKIFIMGNSENGNFKRKNSNLIEVHNNKHESQNNLDDFELNDLEYLEAKIIDQRSFWIIYWSILKREHKIIFTFFIWNDYNLYYIKFMRLAFLICTDMAMNVVFFSDESMHKIYLNYGKYDFYQQITQTIYSVAVSQVIEVFICFLSLTDKHYYQIKNAKKSEGFVQKYQIFQALKCIKLKLIGFFAFTFLFFIFYWYIITCFCAVYQNTQIIYIKDFLLSFILGLIYPIVLYIFPSLLRIISLRACKSVNLSFIYKLSDIIPIF